MSPIPNSKLQTSNSRRSRRGFSFVELLFAVMIMGMGFIMIAVIFPVGVQRTKASFDETLAAGVGRGGYELVAESGQAADFPVTNGELRPMQTQNLAASKITQDNNSNASKLAQTAMIASSDPRYAWVGLYRRNAGEKTAQFCFVVASRSTEFSTADVATVYLDPKNCRVLEPRQVTAQLDQQNGAITLSAPRGSGGAALTDSNKTNADAAGSGTFVLIGAADPNNVNIGVFEYYNPATGKFAVDTGGEYVNAGVKYDRNAVAQALNGRCYRLGNELVPYSFEFYPGYSLSDPIVYIVPQGGGPKAGQIRRLTLNNVQNARAYIVGRNRVAANGDSADFDGYSQDVAYYTGIVYLK